MRDIQHGRRRWLPRDVDPGDARCMVPAAAHRCGCQSFAEKVAGKCTVPTVVNTLTHVTARHACFCVTYMLCKTGGTQSTKEGFNQGDLLGIASQLSLHAEGVEAMLVSNCVSASNKTAAYTILGNIGQVLQKTVATRNLPAATRRQLRALFNSLEVQLKSILDQTSIANQFVEFYFTILQAAHNF